MLKRFSINSLFYLLGMLLNRGLGFLLLPLYIHYLTPTDYGLLAICAATSAVFGILAGPPLESSVSLFYFKLERNEYKKFLGTVLLWKLVVPLFWVILLEFVGPVLTSLFLPTVLWHPYLKLAVWIGYLGMASSTFLELLKAEQRAPTFTVFTVLFLLINISLPIYFIAVRHQGALGSLYGQVIAAAIVALISHGAVVYYSRLRLEWRYLRDALKLCLPYVPHVLCMWVLNISDRWILGHFVPLFLLGIYNLAYSLGVTIQLFGESLAYSFQPLYYENASQISFRTKLPKLLAIFLLLQTWVALAVSVFSPEILRIMAKPDYYKAATLIPWIAVGYLFLSGIYQPAVIVLTYYKRTKWMILLSGPSALFNVVLNWLFIPRYGILAAAINTTLACMLIAVLAVYLSRKLDKLPFPWIKLGQMLFVAVATYWVGNIWFSPHSFGTVILIKGILLTGAGILMAYIAGFDVRMALALLKGRQGIKVVGV